MPWIPEEEIKRAREITAIEYLKKYQPNRLKKTSARNEWELTDHDSFKINDQTSKWHWKSRDIGGTSALNFLIHVDGCSFLEAVQMLKDEYPTYIPPPVEAKPKKPFVLPTASPDCRTHRNDLTFEEWMDLDVKYVKERSFWVDWKIIFKTFKVCLLGRGE